MIGVGESSVMLSEMDGSRLYGIDSEVMPHRLGSPWQQIPLIERYVAFLFTISSSYCKTGQRHLPASTSSSSFFLDRHWCPANHDHSFFRHHHLAIPNSTNPSHPHTCIPTYSDPHARTLPRKTISCSGCEWRCWTDSLQEK